MCRGGTCWAAMGASRVYLQVFLHRSCPVAREGEVMPRDGSSRGRTRPKRSMARRVLVATEGTLTERLYVEGLNSHLRAAGVTVTVQPPRTADALRSNPLGVRVHAFNWSKEIN